MIRTALIYLLTDKCIDRIFDSVESVLSSSPNELRVGMWLKWVQFKCIDDSYGYDVLLDHVVVTRIGSYIYFQETPDTEFFSRPIGLGGPWVSMAIPDGLTQTWRCTKRMLYGWEAS